MQRKRFNLIGHHLTGLWGCKWNYKAVQRSVLSLNGSQLYLELIHIVFDYAVDCLDDGFFLEFVEFVDDVLGAAGKDCCLVG